MLVMTAKVSNGDKAQRRGVANHKIKAVPGFAIVKFMDRTWGLIERVYGRSETEAVIVDDNTSHKLSEGEKVSVLPMTGQFFIFNGEQLCRVPESALLLIDPDKS